MITITKNPEISYVTIELERCGAVEDFVGVLLFNGYWVRREDDVENNKAKVFIRDKVVD